MWFVIFQGISQPLNGKGLHETFAVENFLVVMALCTVLTCLPVMPVNSARRGECWLHFLELTPLIFLSLIVSLCTPGPPVISQTCLVTSAIACSQGGRGEMLHRWEWRRAVVRHFCISFTRRKKKKPEIDRTVPFFWHQQNYPREMRTDLGLLSSGASIMKSNSLIKMNGCISRLSHAATGSAKTTCLHSHFPSMVTVVVAGVER